MWTQSDEPTWQFLFAIPAAQTHVAGRALTHYLPTMDHYISMAVTAWCCKSVGHRDEGGTDRPSPVRPAVQARSFCQEDPSEELRRNPPPHPPSQQPISLDCAGGLSFSMRHALGTEETEEDRAPTHTPTRQALGVVGTPWACLVPYGLFRPRPPPPPPPQTLSPPSFPTASGRVLRGSSLASLLTSIRNVLDGEATGLHASTTAPLSAAGAAGPTVPQTVFDAGVPVETSATIISAAPNALCNSLAFCPPPPPPSPAPSSTAPGR